MRGKSQCVVLLGAGRLSTGQIWKVHGWSNERFFWSYEKLDSEIELRESKHAYLNITYEFALDPLILIPTPMRRWGKAQLRCGFETRSRAG